MKSIFAIAALVVATVVCSVAEARVKRVTIVRRQRIVNGVPVLAIEQPVIAVQRPVELRQLFVPSQQLIIVR